jgi:transcriptional regulator with XRE-family HTH domain
VEDAEQVIENVGLRIGELRAMAGLTQAEVAERIEMTLTNFQRIEHGLQNLTLKTMVKIANAIGVPVAVFFKRPKKKRAKPGRPRGVRRTRERG